MSIHKACEQKTINGLSPSFFHMIDISTRLKHYKRKDVQEAMIYHAQEREIAVRFTDAFGKRPDVLNNPHDILELAKQGATSFHVSEEVWKNPLSLRPELRKQELDDLRKGWDLVIDIDCPVWEYSKLITHFLIQALKENGVSAISCKFSGNKGFHVGVPFESFPRKIGNIDTRLRFPEGVRIIAAYLVKEIDKDNRFTTYVLEKGLINLSEKMGMKKEDIVQERCKKCDAQKETSQQKFEFICPQCNRKEMSEENELMKTCTKCRKIMEKVEKKSKRCLKCNSKEFVMKLDLEKILSVDTLLISSRHLFRMPYSLHEKSGLVSLPLNPNKVLAFDRVLAKPQHIRVVENDRFLDREKVRENNAALLFDRAFQWHLEKEQNQYAQEKEGKKNVILDDVQEALPEELFPPCIQLIQKGIPDGRKRATFILINFLSSVGYDYPTMEKTIYAWNKKNPEQLREVFIKGQLHHHKAQNKKILPPNCKNEQYMKGLGVCRPDSFCARIKNPAQYAKKKAWLIAHQEKGKRKTKKNEEKN